MHHVIPMVCEPLPWQNLLKKPVKLDIEDNWLVVCCNCHSKLTPKNLLTKYGLNKAVQNNERIVKAYAIYERYCEYIKELLDNDIRPTFDDMYKAAEYASGLRDTIEV